MATDWCEYFERLNDDVQSIVGRRGYVLDRGYEEYLQ